MPTSSRVRRDDIRTSTHGAGWVVHVSVTMGACWVHVAYLMCGHTYVSSIECLLPLLCLHESHLWTASAVALLFCQDHRPDPNEREPSPAPCSLHHTQYVGANVGPIIMRNVHAVTTLRMRRDKIRNHFIILRVEQIWLPKTTSTAFFSTQGQLWVQTVVSVSMPRDLLCVTPTTSVNGHECAVRSRVVESSLPDVSEVERCRKPSHVQWVLSTLSFLHRV